MRKALHQAVVQALQKNQWIVTDDPLTLEFAGKLIGLDLAAEKLLAAEQEIVETHRIKLLIYDPYRLEIVQGIE